VKEIDLTDEEILRLFFRVERQYLEGAIMWIRGDLGDWQMVRFTDGEWGSIDA